MKYPLAWGILTFVCAPFTAPGDDAVSLTPGAATPAAPAAPELDDAALLRDLLAVHRERVAIPFILDDLGFGGDRKLAQVVRNRREAARDEAKALEARLAGRLAEAEGAQRLLEFLKPLEGGDLVAFRDACEAAARHRAKWPAETAAGFDAALVRIREARAGFAPRDAQRSYADTVRADLKTRDPYRDVSDPKPAGGMKAQARKKSDAPYTPPVFTPQWSNPVEHWGGPERGAGGPNAHAFLMDELISDKGRAYYEKISGRKVARPERADIIKAIRSEVARQFTADLLEGADAKLERLQDVAVGLSQCESGVNQFMGKGREFEGRSMEGYPVVYLKPDHISWANVVGCMQISCFWWCRSVEEGVHLAWDYRYNVSKGVGEMAKYFGQFRKQGLKGDDLLAKMANRYSGGDWERMQKYLAEPEKWLR